MIVLGDHNLAFVANAKAASRSIRAALAPWATAMHSQPLWDQHMNGVVLRARYPIKLIFGVVREPISWLLSYWRYTRQELQQHDMSADEFAIRYIDGERLWPEPYRTQSDNLAGCDLLFPLDELAHLWDWLRLRGLPVTPHQVGATQSNGEQFSLYVNEQLTQTLASDIALYQESKYG